MEEPCYKKIKKRKKLSHIQFECLEMSSYMKEKDKTDLSKTFFSIRSGTLHIKKWKPWEM